MRGSDHCLTPPAALPKGSGLLTRTAALHGAVGSSVAFGACDVTSPFVQIQTFLTFCAKVSTETGLTVLNFAFWENKQTNTKAIM